jgi:hypothetical protein
MFHLIQHVGSSLRGNQVDRLVRDVVERSMATVRERLSGITDSMSAAELRGYVRARAAQPIRVHAEQILALHRRQDAMLDEVVARALERTVHQIVRQSMMQPVVNMPAAHVRLRAAA